MASSLPQMILTAPHSCAMLAKHYLFLMTFVKTNELRRQIGGMWVRIVPGTREITEVDRFQTEDKFIRAKDLMAEILTYFLSTLGF